MQDPQHLVQEIEFAESRTERVSQGRKAMRSRCFAKGGALRPPGAVSPTAPRLGPKRTLSVLEERAAQRHVPTGPTSLALAAENRCEKSGPTQYSLFIY